MEIPAKLSPLRSRQSCDARFDLSPPRRGRAPAGPSTHPKSIVVANISDSATNPTTLNPCMRGSEFEFLLTVGKIEGSSAVLLTEDHHVLTMPLCILPSDIKPAAVIRVAVRRDAEAEAERRKAITDAQEAILRLRQKTPNC